MVKSKIFFECFDCKKKLEFNGIFLRQEFKDDWMAYFFKKLKFAFIDKDSPKWLRRQHSAFGVGSLEMGQDLQCAFCKSTKVEFSMVEEIKKLGRFSK